MRAEPSRQHEDLAALADGSLPEPRRSELQAQVAADPELAAALEAQRRALARIRAATAEIQAPPGLRERIGALEAKRRRKRLIRFLRGWRER